MRSVRPLALLACAGIVFGAGIAWTVPTEMRPSRNGELDRLSQARPVSYPGEDRVITGPDTYPVTYSPQWLAVAEAAERERMARFALPEIPQPIGYDQPPLERDAAIEREHFDDPGTEGEDLPDPVPEDQAPAT